MLTHDPHPSAPAGPAGAGIPAAVVLDSGALDRLRELDPKGDNQLLPRVLAAFKSSVARLVPQLREASAAGDRAGVRHVAHTLKSSSASIGATQLALLCAELETMIRHDQLDSLGVRVDAMCTEIDGVLAALNLLLDDKR
jgi:HPt (histidine-containing phosphotransfer) domain-containing protein